MVGFSVCNWDMFVSLRRKFSYHYDFNCNLKILMRKVLLAFLYGYVIVIVELPGGPNVL